MASTYSDLKIELIGTGEQSGTWGDTTNVNLGTALEEAIVGRATANFSTDADLTISLTNSNATQVARHYILNVTSGVSLSTTRNLIVPTIDKPYIVENNTTGSQSIVVKTSAGTGVTVPNGKKCMVYANSTNVVQASDYFPVATIGTLTLTTDLALADGGTGASDAPTARTNLGLGTIATQAASNVSITGGSITGITDLAVADGGTGASTGPTALVNLGERTGTTGSLITPTGTDGQRDGSPAAGYFRFNTTSSTFEGYDGSAWGEIGGGGGFDAISVINTNTNAVAGTLYVFTASLTLTLPTSPSVGDLVGVSNLSGTTTSVIGRNSQNIMGLAENLTVDVVSSGFTLTYADATRGWVIT